MLGVIGAVIVIFVGLALLGMVLQLWKIVIATVVGTLIGGPVGGVIGFCIGFVLHNMGGNQKTESETVSPQMQDKPYTSRQSQRTSSHSNITIQSLVPIIQLVCFFCLKKDGQWTTDKVQYVKKTFEQACETQDDLELLQTLMKSKDQNDDAVVQQFIKMRPDDDLKQRVFMHCSIALNYTTTPNKITKYHPT
jgi:uncharacterized membrane protein YraQ (UPF0718 family)